MTLCLALAVFGCTSSAPAPVGALRDEVIYGEDTRRDVYAADSELSRRLALDSSVAFIAAEHLVRAGDGSFTLAADTLAEANNLCPGEAFATQPVAATCSGTLVDDQLVLTAGHCVDAVCDDRQLVFHDAVTDPQAAPRIDGDAIYRCKSIPLRRDELANGGRYDYAFVELDRPVSAAYHPVSLGPADLPAGNPLIVIGYPSGLPVKIDAGAQLLSTRTCRDYFALSSDTFQSSSGSGVFDELGRLIGIFARGGTDYEFLPERGCAVPRHIPSAIDPTQAEQASTLGPAIAALCASGWPSPRLCAGLSDPSDPTAPEAEHCPLEPVEPSSPDAGCTIGRHSARDLLPTAVVLAWMLFWRAIRRPAKARETVVERLERLLP